MTQGLYQREKEVLDLSFLSLRLSSSKSIRKKGEDDASFSLPSGNREQEILCVRQPST